MPFFEIDDVTYHYTLTGGGSLLVLLHGFTGSSENWSRYVDLWSQTYSVLTIDLLGHGKTTIAPQPERYQIEFAARDLAALIQSVRPSETITLLGYSMGGRLALYFALHYPDMINHLILESASPGLADPIERAERQTRDDVLADRIEREGIPAFVDFWEKIPLFESQLKLPENVRLQLRQQRLNNSPLGLANSLRGMGTGVQPSLWEQLPNLNISTRLIVGEYDSKFINIAQHMADKLPNATLQIIPAAGHTVHLENPPAFEQIVLF